jgi:uncharacterized protein YjbI with pentapeptide repeats
MEANISSPGDHSDDGKSSTLPPFAAQASSLDAICKAVEDAAAVSGGLWLSYLFVLFYIAIAAGAVTHADLLLENPVKLPFLSVDLPLKAFFFLSPLLFLVTYAYTLAHLALLADKAKRFHLRLREKVKTQGEGAGALKHHEATKIRDDLRRQLPSNIFVQFLAGPDDIRDSWFGLLLKAIAWTTLVIGPVLLLLLLQIQFLPYHHGPITWTHRLVLLVDLLLVWWLWRKILAGRGDSRRRKVRWLLVLGVVSSFAALIFSWAVATYPGEWQENFPSIRVIPTDWFWGERPTEQPTELVSLHEWFFAGQVDIITRRRGSLFSNTLVLPGFDIYEALKIDDPAKAHSIDLRGRHLERAVFDGANLSKVDLSGAYLQGASLLWTGLQSAALAQAQLQGASLLFTQFQGASLKKAQLQGASLFGAQLMGASLDDAQLQGASLVAVNLSGASLSRADLRSALVVNSQIWGASLERTQLQGASLFSGLAATDLRKAALWRAFGQSDMRELLVSELVWGPQYLDEHGQLAPWTQETYRALRQTVQRLSASRDRTDALKRIERLDCEKKRFAPLSEFDKSIRLQAQAQPSDDIFIDLASCDQKADTVGFSTELRLAFQNAAGSDKTYTKYLAKILGDLVCEGEDIVRNARREAGAMFDLESATPWVRPEIGSIYILRGLIKNGRFQAAGAEAPALAQRILDKDCPVSASLTTEDKESLRGFQKLLDQTQGQQ